MLQDVCLDLFITSEVDMNVPFNKKDVHVYHISVLERGGARLMDIF